MPLSSNTTDPSKPNYRSLAWHDMALHWQKTLDWTSDLSLLGFKQLYLNKVAGELIETYQSRIGDDDPESYFKDAVVNHASIFSQFELEESAPESLVELQDNVDGTGSDLRQWFDQPLNALFRDGGALLGVDLPPANDEVDTDKRPFLRYVPLRDLYWVEYRKFGGVRQLAKISIRRGRTVLNEQKSYVNTNDYWVYELDDSMNCFITQWIETPQGFTHDEPRPILQANGEPLKRIPFTDKYNVVGTLDMIVTNPNSDVAISIQDGNHAAVENPILSPFADVLSLNIEHYNLKNRLNALLGKTALPKPLVFWGDGVPAKPPPFHAGPGRAGNYSADSRVEYLELKGQSVPSLQAQLHDIESKIETRSNKYFSASGNMSRLEADVRDQKSKVGLPRFKSLIESAFQDVAEIWELLSNPTPEDEVGGIAISDRAMQRPADPADVEATLKTVQFVPPNAIVNRLIRIGFYTQEDLEGEPIAPVTPTPVPLPTDPNEVIV